MLQVRNKEIIQNNRLSCSQNLTRPITILSVKTNQSAIIPLK